MKRRFFFSIFVTLILFPTGRSVGQVQIWSESFDLVTPPDLPPNWLTINSGWQSSSSSVSPGSGANNVSHSGMLSGSIVTPVIDLGGYANGELTFLARRTSSYPADSLLIFASVDGGASFPIPVGAANNLPSTPSAYETITINLPLILNDQSSVRLRFDGLGGSTGGANIRLDDISVVAQLLSEPPSSDSTSTLGFLNAASGIFENSQAVPIPLTVETADTLHAIQFSVGTSSASISFQQLERGIPLTDSSAWLLDWEITGDSIHVLLAANNSVGLLPGQYGAIASLVVNSGPLQGSSPENVTLQITDLIASRSSPYGESADISVGQEFHTLTLSREEAFLSVSADTLEFGFVRAGVDTTLQVQIDNLLGNRDVIITLTTTDNPLFVPSDSVYTLVPGQVKDLSITFSPTFTAFGSQSAALSIFHDGNNGPQSNLHLTGIGIAGRGDPSTDGVVDVLDVVTQIDVILGRRQLPPDLLAAADLFPFPLGDGSLDVRDLTVMMHGIVRGIWPDSVSTPSPVFQVRSFSPAVAAGTKNPIAGAVKIVLETQRDGTQVAFLENGASLKGLEVRFSDIDVPSQHFRPTMFDDPSTISSTYFDPDRQTLHVVVASSGSRALEPGRWSLGEFRIQDPEKFWAQSSAFVVTEENEKIPISGEIAVGTFTDEAPETDRPTLGVPYPNPYSLGSSLPLFIPIRNVQLSSQQEFEILDILGRRVFIRPVPDGSTKIRIDPQDKLQRMAPGLYFIRLKTNQKHSYRPLTIVR